MRALVLLVAVLALGRPAHADGPPRRHTATAYALSVGVPLAGLGLAALVPTDGTRFRADLGPTIGGVALVVGPSAGQWYAGRRFTAGLGVRLAGGLIGGWGIYEVFHCSPDHCVAPESAVVAIYAGLGLWAFGTGWDLVTLREAVVEGNASVSITPTVLRDVRGDATPGLALVGGF
jgi:hypothetical protein